MGGKIAFSGIPNKKGSKSRSVPQQRGRKSELAASRGPKRGWKCYITPAFSGIPNIGGKNQKWLPHPYLLGGPKEGGSVVKCSEVGETGVRTGRQQTGRPLLKLHGFTCSGQNHLSHCVGHLQRPPSPISSPKRGGGGQKTHTQKGKKEQALSTSLNADPIGVLHPPSLRLLPLLAWHTKPISVCSAQTRLPAAVALGNNLPPTPNRPLTWCCLGTPATRRPKLGPLNGLGDMQI